MHFHSGCFGQAVKLFSQLIFFPTYFQIPNYQNALEMFGKYELARQFSKNIFEVRENQNYFSRSQSGCIQGGQGVLPQQSCKSGTPPPPQNSELSHFLNLKLKSEEHKKISLLFIQCTKKIVYVNQSHHDRSPNEKSIQNAHSYPNRMGAIIRESEVKQLFVNAKPQSLEFGGM